MFTGIIAAQIREQMREHKGKRQYDKNEHYRSQQTSEKNWKTRYANIPFFAQYATTAIASTDAANAVVIVPEIYLENFRSLSLGCCLLLQANYVKRERQKKNQTIFDAILFAKSLSAHFQW